MANLTYFSVVGNYFAAAGDGPYDAGDPSLAAMSGTLTITPLVTSGDTIEAPTLTPPTNLYLAPVKVQVKHGRIQVNGEDGVRLVANTNVLNLTGQLFYRVEFREGLVARGVTYPLKSFTFQAPTTDTVVDLVTVTPVAGSTVIENIGGAVSSVAGRFGNVLVYVDDLQQRGVTGTALVKANDQAAAWSALGVAPSANLPSYVDDVLEFASQAGFPSSGETGKIYVALDTGDSFRWSGSVYARISDRVTASGITDATTVGRSLVTAADAATGRTVLGGSTIGQQVFTTATTAAARTSLGSGTVGDAVFTAADIVTARTAIEAVGLRPLIHHDPSSQANGAISAGDVLDAGTVFSNTGAKVLKYVSGRFAHDPAASSGASSAGYLQVDCGTAVRVMHSEVSWAANALGVVALVVPSNMATWVGGSVLPAAGFHSGFYGNGQWTLGVWNPGSGGVANGQIHHSVQPGTATSFTLTVTTTTPTSTQTTASITTGTSAASAQSTIQALSNVGASNVTVTKSASGNYGITWAAGLGTVTLTATPTGGTMGMAAPLNLVPANTIPGVVSYATGVTTYAADTTAGRYATVWDGVLRFLRVYLYPETDQALIIFPDGTNSGMITHPGIGLWTNGNRAIFELFESNISAVDTPATLGRIAVGNQKFEPDAPIATKPDVIQALSASKVVTLYDGGNATGSDISVSGSIPPGTAYVELVVIGAGAGGGSGACQPSGTAANGGAGGGSGGVIREIIPASALGTSWSGVIGHRGTGGASVSSTATGNVGTTGTLSKFTSGSVAYQALAGGGGGGGTSGSTAGTAGNGGGPFATVGSAAGANGAAGSAGGGVVANLGTAGSGSGGGVTTAPAANNGGAGGSNLVRGYTGGTAGVVGGASPGQGTDVTATVITSTPAGTPGPGPGGGAASITGAAQAGANAAGWGGGGAGGGASLNGNASGKGGDGVGGYLIVRAHMM